MKLKCSMIRQKLTEIVNLRNHQRMLLTRSLKTTLKKYVSVFSTSVKGIMTKDGLKKLPYVNVRNLKGLAQQLVDENKHLKGTVDKNQEALLEQAKRTAAGEAILAKRAYKASV